MIESFTAENETIATAASVWRPLAALRTTSPSTASPSCARCSASHLLHSPDTVSDLLRILAVLGLVAGNAFFVIGEYAVVTARRAALQGRRGERAPRCA